MATVLAVIPALGIAAPYTIDALIDSAFSASREMKQAREALKRADAVRGEAVGAFMPSLDFAAGYEYAPEVYYPFDVSGSFEEAQSSFPMPGMEEFGTVFSEAVEDPVSHTGMLGLTVRQSLFSGGVLYARYLASKHSERALLCELQAKQQMVKASAIKMFYRALLAEKNSQIRREALALARESHRLAVLQFSVGTGSEIDTLRSRLHREKALMDFERARSDRIIALSSLKSLAGIGEHDSAFAIQGDFPSEEYVVTLADALEQARSNNKGIGHLQAGEEINNARVRMARGAFFPQLVAGASLARFAWLERGEIARLQSDQRLFINLKLNLFDGLSRVERLRQRRAELAIFRWRKEQAYDSLALAVQAAWEKVQLNWKALRQSQALVQLAEKGYDASRSAYEVGRMRLLDFQQGELELNEARLGLNRARFDYHSAVVDLRVLMGNALINDWR
jgi:outer membrane protein